MNAKKCDKCGKYYDFKEDNNAQEYALCRKIGILGVRSNVPVDLCDSCYKKLNDWFTKSAEEKTNESE